MHESINTPREIFDFFKDGLLPTVLLEKFSVVLFNEAASHLFNWKKDTDAFPLRSCLLSDQSYSELQKSIESGTKTSGFFRYTGDILDSGGLEIPCYVFGSKITEDSLLLLFIDIKRQKNFINLENELHYKQLFDFFPVGIEYSHSFYRH